MTAEAACGIGTLTSSVLLLLLNLIISLIIIIVGSPRPRHPLLACAPLHFPTKVSIKSKQNPYVPAGQFCCCNVFLVALVQGFS